MTRNIAVATRELSRTYQGKNKSVVHALDHVSLEIEEGEVRGLLGPNGAGKTTLVKILSTLLLPTGGTASVMGYDVVTQAREVRAQIGLVLGGDRGLYPQLTAREIMEYWAALYHVPEKDTDRRVRTLLERVGLADRSDSKVETYSRGMKQRLHLARGLIGNPRILFLDEPTIGMDPLAARDFRNLVRDLQKEGTTILLTTHDMVEAEQLCDRVALIDHGKLLAVETPESLSKLVSRHERIIFESNEVALVKQVESLPHVVSVKTLPGGEHQIEFDDPTAIQFLLSHLVSAGVVSLRTSRPSLEEVYFCVIGDRGLKV